MRSLWKGLTRYKIQERVLDNKEEGISGKGRSLPHRWPVANFTDRSCTGHRLHHEALVAVVLVVKVNAGSYPEHRTQFQDLKILTINLFTLSLMLWR